MYVCVYMGMFIYTCLCASSYVNVCVYMHMFVYMHANIYVHVYMHVPVCVYAYILVNMCICIYIVCVCVYIYILAHCLVSRVFANGPRDWGLIPGWVIPKTLKVVLDTSLLNNQHYKIHIKSKVEQSMGKSSALPYALMQQLLKSESSGHPQKLKLAIFTTYIYSTPPHKQDVTHGQLFLV